MLQSARPIMTHGRLLLFKWLMVFLPSLTVTLGHSLWEHRGGGEHSGALYDLPATLLVTAVGLLLTYLFVETLYRVLWRLQAEALAREQDIQTMRAVMQERARLSRELHDGIAQLVAHLLLRLDTIQALAKANRFQAVEAELERLHGVADELYQDIGESITGLRTNLTEQGLVSALQDYVEQFEERYGIPTTLRADAAADLLPPLAALQVFRFIQEALTNVRKHAAAHEASVTLAAEGPGPLRIVITDDGQGFSPGTQPNRRAKPLGLTSMRERVEALGGTFQVHSQPGSGTQVMATLAIPRTRQENQ
jgi:two-component system, NarL family, sensor histidine kinase DegS